VLCGVWRGGGLGLTLVRDLHDGPEGFVFLLAFVGGGLRVFHFVGEFQEGVFDVVEAFGWGLAVASCAADRGHAGREGERIVVQEMGAVVCFGTDGGEGVGRVSR
jgi:hypothetical protein